MLGGPFSPWPSFSDEEAEAVKTVLLSNRVNYWTGQECRYFEKEFAGWCEARNAIAVANGTLALDLALAGLGVGSRNGGSSDDEVIVTPRTFMASVSTVAFAGAVPVFADIDPDSGNLTAGSISKVVTSKTKAIIVVHLAGWPCDMEPIMALAEAAGIKVIEDCAQAHGARYRGLPIGSIGHVAAWSFCQDKIMTTGGEGGMVTTNDQELWSRMWAYKDHGKSWEATYKQEHPPGFRWLHNNFGTNWRMTELQAVIGRIQLTKIDDWSKIRVKNAAVLQAALRSFSSDTGPVRLPKYDILTEQNSVHAQYKFYAYVRPRNLAKGWNRNRIVDEIRSCGVPCFQGACSEVYLEKAFDGTQWRPKKRLPNARDLGETSLMFLVHPTLTEEELSKSQDVITAVLRKASLNQHDD